jgi:hypothetical protein
MNIPDTFDEVSDQGRLGKSDHVMIFTKISGGGTGEDQKTAPDWRRADWDTMRAVLREDAWLRQLRSQDAQAAWATVKEKVTVERYVPNRRLRNQNRPAWLSQEILRAISTHARKNSGNCAKEGSQLKNTRQHRRRSKTESAMRRGILRKTGGWRTKATFLCLCQKEDTEQTYSGPSEDCGRRNNGGQ